MTLFERTFCGETLWQVRNGLSVICVEVQLFLTSLTGGAGVEYYFGYSYDHSDLTCQDLRSRDNMWTQSKYALDFFTNNGIPFWG